VLQRVGGAPGSHQYPVTTRDIEDLTALRRTLGIPDALASCHVAVVAEYVVEGHVPGDVIDRLLRERPPIVGVAVPGMPPGAPGMEVPGQKSRPYRILAFDRAGRTTIFESR
jgi:hypothetical protein